MLKFVTPALFLAALVAQATTTVERPSGRLRNEFCELRARFAGVRAEALSGGAGKRGRSQDAVYWELEPVGNPGDGCPAERSVSVRVRAASFHSVGAKKIITYAMDIREPAAAEIARFHVRFVRGKDTYLNREFAEWTLVERLRD